MSLRKKILLGSIAVLLLTFIIFMIWSTGGKLSRHEEQITYPSPEVLLNPYLAAEHFLKKQGITFKTSQHFNKALRQPASGKTLLFLADRTDLSQAQTEQLLEWAGWGGHLLVIAIPLSNKEKNKTVDLLLDSLAIERRYNKNPLQKKTSKDPKAKDYSNLTKLYLENESSPAYIGFNPRHHLYDSEERAHVLADDDITHILQLHHGDGLITVMSDAWIWKNYAIAQYDNAWLLWYLTHNSEVILFNKLKPQANNLLTALFQHFPEALAALVLLLLFWLWYKGHRQGALLSAAPHSRRQLKEHLSASADFLLRQSGRAHLLEKLQHNIQQHAKERHPRFALLDESARLKLLAQLSGQTTKQVQQALRTPDKQPSAAEFSRQVKDLQTLRNAL